jgi:single-stranded-DNA-specific exonuclease
LRHVDPATVSDLSAALGVHQVTARCIAGRGVSDAARARAYLEPRLGGLRQPQGLAGLEEGVERLVGAIRQRETIGVFGDYDVDGVTTTALLTAFFASLGVKVVPRVAQRAAGYGFGPGDAQYFAEQGCQLLVTGDCGTSDVAAITEARQRGLDTIVVDHHTVPEGAPVDHPARALINPFRADSTFPFRGMASVGLAFYLAAAVRTRLRETGHFGSACDEPDLRELLDLVALGTIADLVPLTGENRILTAVGLGQLALRRRPGLAALLARAGVASGAAIDERTVGWKLAPRLNAPGRLGDAMPALRLLLSRDAASAEAAAGELEDANLRRRELQDAVLAEALDQQEQRLSAGHDDAAVVVAGRGWASGVVGIVAAKLVERYRRPAFVIAVDDATGEGRGSARTPAGIDLYRALATCRDRLVRFGGHAAAAGLTVRESEIDALRAELSAAVRIQESLPEAGAGGPLTADAQVNLAEVDERLVQELIAMAPFGNGNEQPMLVGCGMRVRESRRVGDGSHLKLLLDDATGRCRPGIAFGRGHDDPGPGARIDVAFAPGINRWNGRTEVELTVRAFWNAG